MCFSGGSSKPAPPPPPPARPPREMNTQPSPTPANTEAPGASTAADEKKKGRNILKIPLIEGSGSGVQIPN